MLIKSVGRQIYEIFSQLWLQIMLAKDCIRRRMRTNLWALIKVTAAERVNKSKQTDTNLLLLLLFNSIARSFQRNF